MSECSRNVNERARADDLVVEAAMLLMGNAARADRERAIRLAAPPSMHPAMVNLAIERSGRLALARFDKRLRVRLEVEAQR